MVLSSDRIRTEYEYKRSIHRSKITTEELYNINRFFTRCLRRIIRYVQGPPYVLRQAILPTTQYQVGILNCSWTQMKDTSLYQKNISIKFFVK